MTEERTAWASRRTPRFDLQFAEVPGAGPLLRVMLGSPPLEKVVAGISPPCVSIADTVIRFGADPPPASFRGF